MVEGSVTWTDIAKVGLVAIQLGVLIAAALVAWRQVTEARTLREQQNRPFVVVDFDVEGSYLTFLEVANLGTSLAREVRIEIDPPLESATEGVEVRDLKMLNEGIATLAPGKRYRTLFDMGFRRADSDLPMNYAATITYWDEAHKRPFREELNLDLDLFVNLRTINRAGLHGIHKQLEQLQAIIKKWSSGTGGGLVAMSLEESRAEAERIVAEMRGRRDQQET
jgi:hypothetical protein